MSLELPGILRRQVFVQLISETCRRFIPMLGGGMVLSSGHRLYLGFASQRTRRQGG